MQNFIAAAGGTNNVRYISQQCQPLQRCERKSCATLCALHRVTWKARAVLEVFANHC